MMKGMKVLNKASCCPSVKPVQKQNMFAPRPFAPQVEEHEAPAAGTGISFSFADISILPRETVQPKLVLGPVGDKYEQEADRVARQVVETISSPEQESVQRQENLEDEDELDLEEALEEEDELIQGKFASVYTGILQAKEEAPPNKTGMPDRLKSGLENLSGMDLSAVRVHYNSPKPTQLNALAYTQGQEIHLAPGREKHLPHEGWHAVQQMQGRVTPTGEVGAMPLNDSRELEAEADSMGWKALQIYSQVETPKGTKNRVVANSVAQEINNMGQGFGFMYNRQESIAQRKLQVMCSDFSSPNVVQKIKKNYGTPSVFCSHMEDLSGNSSSNNGITLQSSGMSYDTPSVSSTHVPVAQAKFKGNNVSHKDTIEEIEEFAAKSIAWAIKGLNDAIKYLTTDEAKPPTSFGCVSKWLGWSNNVSVKECIKYANDANSVLEKVLNAPWEIYDAVDDENEMPTPDMAFGYAYNGTGKLYLLNEFYNAHILIQIDTMVHEATHAVASTSDFGCKSSADALENANKNPAQAPTCAYNLAGLAVSILNFIISSKYM